MMNAESVKARLKNFAKDTSHTFQQSDTPDKVESLPEKGPHPSFTGWSYGTNKGLCAATA